MRGTIIFQERVDEGKYIYKEKIRGNWISRKVDNMSEGKFYI